MEKDKKSEIHITNNFNAPIGQHIDHVDTIYFRMDGDGTFHFGTVDNARVEKQGEEEEDDDIEEATPADKTLVQKCFKHDSDFIKQKVAAIVKDFYQGSAVNMALIEITLFDHNQLKKRNAHTPFLKALIAWGIIDNLSDEELKNVANGMTTKMKKLPAKGYKEWDGNAFVNEKKFCTEIGAQLGDTIPYSRQKEE